MPEYIPYLSGNHRIPEEMANTLRQLPPLEKGHIRLYRATIDTIESKKAHLEQVERKWKDTTFLPRNAQDMNDLKRVASGKHRRYGGFYSDSLATTLPYFARHHDDQQSDRVLQYIDLPIEKVRKYYLENVPTMQPGNPKKWGDFKHDFMHAFVSCKQGEEQDEFFLPQKLIRQKKPIMRIRAPLVYEISEAGWKKYGAELDKEFMDSQGRAQAKIYHPQSLVEKIKQGRAAENPDSPAR